MRHQICEISRIKRVFLEAVLGGDMRTATLVFLTLSLLGCGETSTAYICEPGELQACPCIGGGEGVQACGTDRLRWEACQCEIEQDPTVSGGAESNTGPGDIPTGQAGMPGGESSTDDIPMPESDDGVAGKFP